MSDVEWHPVGETPPESDVQYFVCPPRRKPAIALYIVDGEIRTWYENGKVLRGVTHWANIEYPDPPEEA
jgi:antitoxin component YwqK of YwqJK toxin-antitoxin module